MVIKTMVSNLNATIRSIFHTVLPAILNFKETMSGEIIIIIFLMVPPPM